MKTIWEILQRIFLSHKSMSPHQHRLYEDGKRGEDA